MRTLEPRPLPEDFFRAHQAFSTRRVPRQDMQTLLTGPFRPEVGQLVLARVTQLGQHRHVELVHGRKASLYPEDLVILAYGNRYAPDQFEALVPLDLGPCEMVAGGGLAARAVERHAAMSAPTRIQPLGILADAQGEPLNLCQYRLPDRSPPLKRLRVYVVCGTSMNAGKTYTVAMLIRGQRAMGRRVAGCKITGTGSGNDLWRMHDAGASPVLDFADNGLPSTYGTLIKDLEIGLRRLIYEAAAQGADSVVVEIADGLGQAETAGLLHSDTLRELCDGLVFAAADPLGAAAGERWIEGTGLRLLAISGVMTTDPTSVNEARSLVRVPVLTAEHLALGGPFVSADSHAVAANLGQAAQVLP